MLWSMREVLVAGYPLERAEPDLVWKCGFQIGDFFSRGVRFPNANGAPFPCTDRPCQSAVKWLIMSSLVSAVLVQGYLGLQQGSHRSVRTSLLRSRVHLMHSPATPASEDTCPGKRAHVLSCHGRRHCEQDGAETALDDSCPVSAPCGHRPAFALKMVDLPGPRFGAMEGAEQAFSLNVSRQSFCCLLGRVTLFSVCGCTCTFSSHRPSGTRPVDTKPTHSPPRDSLKQAFTIVTSAILVQTLPLSSHRVLAFRRWLIQPKAERSRAILAPKVTARGSFTSLVCLRDPLAATLRPMVRGPKHCAILRAGHRHDLLIHI